MGHMRCQQGRRKQRRCVRHYCRAPGVGISTAKRRHSRAAERRRHSRGEVTVRPAIVGQQREDGTGQHEAACSRPRRRAPGADIPAGAVMSGSRAAGSGDGTPGRTATDATAHDGRWTLRWCKHSRVAGSTTGILPMRTRGAEQGWIWAKMELTGGPRLSVTAMR
jgi:hypothetical protein